MQANLAERIDACLPQTQCGQCGFADCRRYAEALARGAASLNACPPGGEAVREALADIVGAALEPPEPIHPAPRLEVARIDESDCIGCTKCLSACPLDALVGAAGLMHGVVDAWCSGCGLCVPVCPTDCIELVPLERFEDRRVLAARWRVRYQAHRARHAREAVHEPVLVDLGDQDPRQLEATIAASVARHRALD